MSLRSSGLKLKSSKRLLFRKVVMYLGHIFSVSGIKMDPVKVEQVCGWPVSVHVTEIKSFLGLVSYYWHVLILPRWLGLFANCQQLMLSSLGHPKACPHFRS